MKHVRTFGLLILLAGSLVFPLVFPNPAFTTIVVFTLLFAAAAVSWNIFSGYTGYISLGHGTFFGLGAYTLGIACQEWHIQGDYTPFLLLPLAGLVAGGCAIPLGWIALRTKRQTFVVITIAIFFILQLLAYNLRSLTNGSTGISLPNPSWSGDFFNVPFYYVALAVLLLTLFVSWWVRYSKYGLGLLAIRDDEDRALGLGVKTGLSKLVAFVISAVFVGVVGGIYAYFVGSIYPPFAFDPTFDVGIALMTFFGGIGTLAGPILGALIVEPVQQYLTLLYGENGLYLIILGALLLAVLLLLPRGVLPTLQRQWSTWMRRQRKMKDVEITPFPGTTRHEETLLTESRGERKG